MGRRVLSFIAVYLFFNVSVAHAVTDPENTLIMELESGKVVIELLPDVAPQHVARVKELAREGFYDGLGFFRGFEDIYVQTGDPTNTGEGGSGQLLKEEFNDTQFKRGTVFMMRKSHPNTADSQMVFVLHEYANWFDGSYTAFGRVISGIEHLDALKKVDIEEETLEELEGWDELVENPDSIVSVKVMSDI